MTLYDVIVIGAGPGGSAAAYHASRGGLRVLIIDRVEFPREKTCGDALVPAAVAALARMGIADLPGHRVRGLKIVHSPSAAKRIEEFRDGASGLVVTRSALDHVLVERARMAGAEFRSATARHVVADGHSHQVVVLDTATGLQEARAHAVVLATGSGRLASLLGPTFASERRVWGIAGRAYLDVSAPPGDLLEVYFPVMHEGQVRSGFAWVFPESNTRVNIGVGMFRSSDAVSPRLLALMEAFISERRAHDARFRDARRADGWRSASIAIGPELPDVPGLLPVGDCAGLAHGLTGEGIGAALESGELAAQVLLERPADPAAVYRSRLRQLLPRQFSLSPALADIHTRPQLALGRGWDVFGQPHRSAGVALRSVLLDAPRSEPPIAQLLQPSVRTVVVKVQQRILHDAHRLRPMIGELVSDLMTQPEAGFGWCTAFAAAVRETLLPESPKVPAEVVRILAILETVGLVARLHLDCLPVGASAAQSVAWGRNTVGLVLADCLTARALGQLYTLEEPWSQYIGKVAAQSLRRRAEACRRGPQAQLRSDLDGDVLVAAAHAAVLDETMRLPGCVGSAASMLATRRAVDDDSAAWRSALTALRASGQVSPEREAASSGTSVVVDSAL